MKRWTFAAAMTTALVAASCASVDDKTQITVALSSETEIPRELDSFALRVFSTRTGELRFSQDYFPKSGREFPTTLAVIPFDESSLGSPIRIELEGRQGGNLFLRRQSVVSYVEGRNLLLKMPLRMACFQFKDCGPSATCAGGECVPAEVSAAALVDYDPKYVFGEGGTCFDEEACLADSVEVDIEEDCTFAIGSAPVDGKGNLAVRWAAAPDRILALDANEPREGWTRIALDRGKLSKGICDSHFQRRGPDGALLVPDWARTVYWAKACESKSGLLPYCFSLRTQHAGIGARL